MRFTEEHLWMRTDDDMVVIGITEFAAAELGEIVFVQLPDEGDVLVKDDDCAVVESDKTTSDILAPIGGEIVEVNLALAENPGLLADDPLGAGWLVTIAPEDIEELEDYMTESEYKVFAR